MKKDKESGGKGCRDTEREGEKMVEAVKLLKGITSREEDLASC